MRVIVMQSVSVLLVTAVCGASSVTIAAQAPAAAAATSSSHAVAAAASEPSAAPPGYTIGPDDVLGIVFWRDKDLTTDVQVRPDGKISLPLLNDVQAAGLTPE